MKTFKTTLLTIAVLLCSISMKAQYLSPDFGVNGIQYNITSSSERTVEVSWRSCQINDSGTVYERYYFNNSYYGNIVIPENVTYEGETYTVTSIAEGAFYKCPNLISITIPKTVTNIERINHKTGDVGAAGIFFGCTGLAEIVIEEGNPIYDSRNNCNAIIETNTNTLIEGCKNTIIPNTIKNIGEHAFYECTDITSIFIPNSVEKIGNNAFEGCRIKDLTIPNSVKDLGHETFANNALVNIVVGDSVTKIGGYTFYGNTGIQSLVIGKSVTTISDDSFYHKVKGRIINLSTLSKSVINDNVADDYVQIINVDNQKYELYGDWIFRRR